ncbi:hypothetical protein ACFW24_16750 [Streptomyces nigra]|uniref:hypothetical protein n=1 Tax=Streptomyces nigra TaxID=1827580 RepID=UPI0036C39DE9
MVDSTLWISALTAGTAVLASWVTSRGTSKAAEIQATASQRAQRVVRVSEARRAAYVSLIEQAHRMAELYWAASDIYASEAPRVEQLPRLKEVRASLREEYAKLRHHIFVIALEGPDDVAAAAEAVRLATRPPYQALEASIAGDPQARSTFDQCYEPFWNSVLAFVSVARPAVHDDAP